MHESVLKVISGRCEVQFMLTLELLYMSIDDVLTVSCKTVEMRVVTWNMPDNLNLNLVSVFCGNNLSLFSVMKTAFITTSYSVKLIVDISS